VKVPTRLVVALALLFPACGDDDGDALGVGNRGLDRCSLITSEEAEDWLGPALYEPAPAEGIDGEPDLVTCRYENEKAIMLVQVYDGEEFYAEEGSPARTGETIEGLGEDAWLGDGDVNFLQDGWTVSASRIAGEIPDEDLIEIAQLMSSRLP
jgi:hypothetical protein